MSQPPNRNYALSEAFVEELARSGLHHACICPGSRSTPLIMSLAKQATIRTWVHIDERSASFFALGISRALNEPVAMVSTSGTAATNFYPAVLEAHYSHIPILIMTADRPPELLDWGSNQTIDQTRLYGTYSKWFLNIGSSEATPDYLRYVREAACRALTIAKQSPSGPVHLNVPFREPLVPKRVSADISVQIPDADQNAWVGRAQGKAYTQTESPERSVTPSKIKELAQELHGLRHGIVVCGPQEDSSLPSAVSRLAEILRFPILADPLSEVRCGRHERRLVIDSYDTFLRSEKCVRELKPELILRFGATPTSKMLQNYMAQHHHARHILVHEGDWQDPTHIATDMFQASPRQFATQLATAVEPNPDRAWCDRWMTVHAGTKQAIGEELQQFDEIFEGKIFTELSTLLPSDATVFAGNSMPVRDLDAFYPSTPQTIRFLANRGVSGIDGVVSTALGASVVTRERTVLVVGDLSFYHDMNGLLSAKQYRPNTTIILVNNNGGGIFSFLPQREYTEIFERYFATPHGLTFQSAAAMYALPYLPAATWQEFDASVSKSLKLPGTSLVELQTNRDRNVQLHERVWSAATNAAEKALTEPD